MTKTTPKKKARRVLLSLLIIPVLVYLGLALALFLLQAKFIFPGTARSAPTTPPPSEVTVLTRDIGDGELVEAWFAPGAAISDERPGPCVIYFHGNGELIDDAFDHMRPYLDIGVSLLLVEYRGFGRSGGAPTQAGVVDDAVAFRQMLLQRADVDPDRLFYHGRSLGGGVACALADRHTPTGLILESTFTSIASFASRYAMPTFLVRHPFRNDHVLPTLDAPVLLLHGESDTLIDPSHSRTLESLAPNARLVMMPGAHNDFPTDPEQYWSTVRAFVPSATLPR